MTLLYFLAGAIAVISLVTALGAIAFASAFGSANFPGIAIALIATALVAGLVAWWASTKGAARWPR